jgi:ABC-2 type transport system permease protein
LKETLVAPVSRLQIMIGRTLGGATVATIQGLIVFFLSMLVGFRPAEWSALPVLLIFMFLIAFLFTALGTAVASMLEDLQGFQLIMNFLVMPLFFLSGALFPIQGLPKVLLLVVKFNPLAYGVDGMRAATIHGAYFGISFDFAVLSCLAVIISAIGAYLFSRIQI